MYYCKKCDKAFSVEDLKTEKRCFETEYAVGNLFQSRHYYLVYLCPECNSEDDLVEAEKCDVCGEYFPDDYLTDTTEYSHGGVGYACDDCIVNGEMIPIMEAD
jgi:hypothetical protein